MRAVASSLILGLAWFAAVNAVASLAAWLIARRVSSRDADTSAGALLAVRLAPAALSAAFVAFVFVPVHWMLEPAAPQETFGVVLLAATVTGLGLVLRGVARAASVMRAEAAIASLPRIADAVTEPIEITGLPGVSLAGVLRTRILVGTEARAALTADELDVAIAHERAHRTAWDNVKRFAMFCAPDFFGWSRAAKDVEQRWRAEAECLADASAVGDDRRRAISLASALVKVASLATEPRVATTPVWSTFHEASVLERRVRRLVSGARVTAGRLDWSRTGLAVAACGLAAVWMTGVPASIHQITETLVRLLP